MIDMLPDYETPDCPKGFKYGPMRVPKVGDWLVDYYGKPYKVTKGRKEHLFESHQTFIKIKKSKKKK